MSTSNETAEFVEDQLATMPVRTGKMFGEYAIYLGDKVVGIKPSKKVRNAAPGAGGV